MGRRRKNNTLNILFDIASAIPWWISIFIAIGSWFVLHPLANQVIKPPAGMHGISQQIMLIFLMAFASIGQYVLPVVFTLGALSSVIVRAKRKKLHSDITSSSATTINTITWHEFEQLVGEVFRRDGYHVAENTSGGADGGIDLKLKKDGELFLVQCKQWRAQKVGVTVVRELYGVMASCGAAGGFVITSGYFTEEAKSFAHGRNVLLIDGNQLNQWLKTTTRQFESSETKTIQLPTCPSCNSQMIRRMAKKGSNMGKEFWGCSRYPACKGILQIT